MTDLFRGFHELAAQVGHYPDPDYRHWAMYRLAPGVAWEQCPRIDWMLGMACHVGADDIGSPRHRRASGLLHLVAHSVRDHLPHGAHEAMAALRSWCDGAAVDLAPHHAAVVDDWEHCPWSSRMFALEAARWALAYALNATDPRAHDAIRASGAVGYGAIHAEVTAAGHRAGPWLSRVADRHAALCDALRMKEPESPFLWPEVTP